MKIGVGVTTNGRYDHLKYFEKSLKEHSPSAIYWHVANDTKSPEGVAFRKTECLRELKKDDVDYYFLFDDDCFVQKKGWAEFFIDAMERSGNNHFIYTHECPSNKLIKVENGIGVYENSHGCLMVMTRKAVETVGGFSPEFKRYGGEHSNYSHRIHRAGLNPMGAYLCPIGAEEYIYSCDLDNTKPEIQKQLKHRTSMHPLEAVHHASKGLEVFQKPTNIFYPL